MLVDPNIPIPLIQGTHILSETFGLVGVTIEDPKHRDRVWTVSNLFGPSGRALGGIRAKLVDSKGFVSFVNQRDLELLLDLARPGQWCLWLEKPYPGINDHQDGWYGICCDESDLVEDLHERELHLRHHFGGVIPNMVELTRRIHYDEGNDQEELLAFLWDKDPDTNLGPDGRLETVQRRWASVERRRMQWKALR